MGPGESVGTRSSPGFLCSSFVPKQLLVTSDGLLLAMASTKQFASERYPSTRRRRIHRLDLKVFAIVDCVVPAEASMDSIDGIGHRLTLSERHILWGYAMGVSKHHVKPRSKAMLVLSLLKSE